MCSVPSLSAVLPTLSEIGRQYTSSLPTTRFKNNVFIGAQPQPNLAVLDMLVSFFCWRNFLPEIITTRETPGSVVGSHMFSTCEKPWCPCLPKTINCRFRFAEQMPPPKVCLSSAGSDLIGCHSAALDVDGRLYTWGVGAAAGHLSIKPVFLPRFEMNPTVGVALSVAWNAPRIGRCKPRRSSYGLFAYNIRSEPHLGKKKKCWNHSPFQKLKVL